MIAPRVVLVAEDDVFVRNLINTVLTRAGYSVLLAADGTEALELSRHFAGDIHLLLSDVMMPGIDGLKLAAKIHEERPGTPALLISGKTSSEIVQGNVLFDFLAKPFVPAQLKAKLNEVMSRVGRRTEFPDMEEI